MSETVLFPAGGPRPSPRPARQVIVHRHGLTPGMWLPWAGAAVVVAGFLGWETLRDRGGTTPPAPVSDGVALGRAFAPRLAAALADGFDAEADALERGKTVGEADAALKDTFHKARSRAFAEHAAPSFAAIMPAGTEPKDEATRKTFGALHRDFARGLREASK